MISLKYKTSGLSPKNIYLIFNSKQVYNNFLLVVLENILLKMEVINKKTFLFAILTFLCVAMMEVTIIFLDPKNNYCIIIKMFIFTSSALETMWGGLKWNASLNTMRTEGAPITWPTIKRCGRDASLRKKQR